MKIVITLSGDFGQIEETYQGWPTDLHSRDWNKRVRGIIDRAEKYEEEYLETIDEF